MQRPQANEFHYTGPINPNANTNPQSPLSCESARVVALSAWRLPGRIHITEHFTMRTRGRNFSILDAEEVLRRGKPIDDPMFCPEPHNNYKYKFRAGVDGTLLEIAFAIDATQDYLKAPLVILITGVWKTRSGIRR